MIRMRIMHVVRWQALFVKGVMLAVLLICGPASAAQGPSIQDTQEWIIRSLSNYSQSTYVWSTNRQQGKFSYTFDAACHFIAREEKDLDHYKVTRTITIPVMDVSLVDAEPSSWGEQTQKHFHLVATTKGGVKSIRVEEPCPKGRTCGAPDLTYQAKERIGDLIESRRAELGDLPGRLTKAFLHLQKSLAGQCKVTKELF